MWVRGFDPKALNKLPDFPGQPDLVLVFGTTQDLKDGNWPQLVREHFRQSIVLGCSSGTMVAGDRINDEAAVGVAIGFAKTRIKLARRPVAVNQDDFVNGVGLGLALKDSDLSAVFMLSDGLSVNASALVDGLRSAVGDTVAISGGLAGDGPRFEETVVLVGSEVVSGEAVAIGLYGQSIKFSHGSEGGWETFGPTRTITSSCGTSLLELDDAPALELYERYLGEEAADLPASGLLFPLEIWSPDAPDRKVVRTLIGIDRETRSMNFAGDMPEGWHARLMQGTVEALVSGAACAAEKAVQDFGEVSGDTLCLLVSCVGRRLMMGQRAEDEVEEVFSYMPSGTVVAGFFSYGEVAPHHVTGETCLHNQTMTLTLLGEAA